MKNWTKKWTTGLAAAVLALVAASGAQAGAIYSNGAANGAKDAWLISGGYTVSDSFTLSQAATITSIDFLLWDYTSEGTVTNAIWSITSGIDSGTEYGGSSTAALTGTAEGTNTDGYKLTSESFSTGSLMLGPGTYWLNLVATSPSGSVDLFWDEGDGPSQAYSSNANNATAGYITPANFPIAQYPAAVGGCSSPGVSGDCSESFDINGTSSGSATPEPATGAMLAGAILVLAAWSRKRA